MNKAEELIACLEGEIAKRDETIARLEPQLNRAIQANYDLREELSAIKAQQPVIDELAAFEDWWPSVGQTIGKVAALEAWQARAQFAIPVVSAEQQGVATLSDIMDAYYYATDHPDKYLRGTTNWCAAFRFMLNKKLAAAPAPSTTEGQGDE